MIRARFMGDGSKVHFLAIERMSDGAWFNWSAGKFDSKFDRDSLALMSKNTARNGYESLSWPNHQYQFEGDNYIVVLFAQTGRTVLRASHLQAVVMLSAYIQKPPYAFRGNNLVVEINETPPL